MVSRLQRILFTILIWEMKYMSGYLSGRTIRMCLKPAFLVMYRLTVPFKGVADKNTQMTLGSNLEILEIATGKRDIIYSVPYSIQAPNWTRGWEVPDFQ